MTYTSSVCWRRRRPSNATSLIYTIADQQQGDTHEPRWICRLIAILTLASLLFSAPGALQARTDQRCFAETGYCISGRMQILGAERRPGGLRLPDHPAPE